MQNATVREYTRRCNSHSQGYRSLRPSYLHPRDPGGYKESAACPITKASNSSHFHIPLFFLFSTFPVMQYQKFFSFFGSFSHLRNFKTVYSVELLPVYHKDRMFRLLNKVKTCSMGLVLGWVTEYKYPMLW